MLEFPKVKKSHLRKYFQEKYNDFKKKHGKKQMDFYITEINKKKNIFLNEEGSLITILRQFSINLTIVLLMLLKIF